MLTCLAFICFLACVGSSEAAKFNTEFSLKIQSLGLPEDVDGLHSALLEVSEQGQTESMNAMIAKMRQAVKARMTELSQEAGKHQSAVEDSMQDLESCLPAGTNLVEISSAKEKVDALHESWNRLDYLEKDLTACQTRASLLQQNQTWFAQKRRHIDQIKKGGLALAQKTNHLILAGQKEKEAAKAAGKSESKRRFPVEVKCTFKPDEDSPEAVARRIDQIRDQFARELQNFVCPSGGGPRSCGGGPCGGGFGYNAGCANAQPCCQQASAMKAKIATQMSSCASNQRMVEQNSCGIRRVRPACASFNPCFKRKQSSYKSTVSLALEKTESLKEKYQTLLKQQCVVNAYDEGDDESGNVESKVQSCAKAEVSDADLAFLKLKSDDGKPQQLALLSEACSGPEEPLPGSEAFLQKYANKDGISRWGPCKASCGCGSTA